MKFDKKSYIEELAQDLALKAHLRWEEIQVEKATTEQLIKAKEMIENELVKRRIKEQTKNMMNGYYRRITNERNRKDDAKC